MRKNEREFAYYISVPMFMVVKLSYIVDVFADDLKLHFFRSLAHTAIFEQYSTTFSNATFYDSFFMMMVTAKVEEDAVKSANKYWTNDSLVVGSMAHIGTKNKCNETYKWLGGRCTNFNWIIIYVQFIFILLLYLPVLCALEFFARDRRKMRFNVKFHFLWHHFQTFPIDCNHMKDNPIFSSLHSQKYITSNSFIVMAASCMNFFYSR